MPLSYAQTEKLINRIYNNGTMIETKINAYKSCHHQTSETMQFIQGKAQKSKSMYISIESGALYPNIYIEPKHKAIILGNRKRNAICRWL